MTIASDTIPLVTDLATFFTEWHENNVISYYPVYQVIKSPASTVKVRAKVRSECVHGKWVEIIGIRERKIWFLCREADQQISFIVVDIEYMSCKGTLRLRRSLRLEGGIQSI